MDDQQKPHLADDPVFLASLDELEAGLSARAKRVLAPPGVKPLVPRPTVPAPSPPLQPPPPPPQQPAPTVVAAPPGPAPIVPRQGGGRRALLDLFPPTPAARPLAPPPSPLAAQAPSSLSTLARQPFGRPALVDMLPPLEPGAVAYQTYYGFSEPPFSRSSDPKFLYRGTAHDLVAQELLSAIRRRDAVVIVTGAAGMGKTMLCRGVLDQLDRRTLTSFVADPSAPIETILQTILVDFGVISHTDLAGGRLAHASRHDLMAALREFLTSLAPLDAFAVVIVDDAHRLAADALDQIRSLSDGEDGKGLLQIVLVGQARLVTLLKRAELRPFARRASVRCVLGSLNGDEIVGYVLLRLAVAGPNARVEFDDDAFERLYALSAGVPHVINLLCDRALTLGYGSSASVIDGPLIDRAAEELDITAPESRAARLARTTMTIAALLVLMLVGAGAAAFVFHERVAQTLARWQAAPPEPRHPSLRQPAPFTPAPSPSASSPSPSPPGPRH